MSKLICRLVGDPVSHSVSPAIHHAFAKQFDLPMEYHVCLVRACDFAETLREYRARGVLGVNVTMPHKSRAYAFADHHFASARASQAANTLILGERVMADNTDGIGLMRALTRQNITLAQQRVLLLGAGGAARNVLPHIRAALPKSLHVANRDAKKAQHLQQQYPEISISTLSDLPDTRFDVVINATSASLQGQLAVSEPALIHPRGFYLDMVYQADSTVFVEWVTAHGGVAVDGKEMLVEQAAQAFWLWTGKRPLIEPLLDQGVWSC